MKKIKTLFAIDYSTRPHTIKNEINDGCEWVMKGEGIATIKWDGTAAMVKDGKLYKRYDRKTIKAKRKYPKGYKFSESDLKPMPDGFIPCEEKPDLNTGHHPGWLPVDENNPQDKYFIEAWNIQGDKMKDGTYELVGEKINNNNHNFTGHAFIKHGYNTVDIDRTFDGVKKYLEMEAMYEGIVFHRDNGDMCKIRRKDFGFKWGNQ